MSIKHTFIGSLAVLGSVSVAAVQAAPVGWDAYVIRQNGATSPAINESYNADPNQVQFVVNLSGQKAGLGTNLINGTTIGQIGQLSIDRLDDYTRFATNNGGYYAPYMNIWVKDANGKYAVLANEPSNVEWSGLSEWNTSGANLATKTVKVFEIESGFTLPAGITPGHTVHSGTFADFAGYTIEAPDDSYLLSAYPAGSGAARELGTGLAYGFNWIFGDSGANYVADTTGFIVGNPSVSAVPEPTTLGLVGIAGLGLLARRRKTVAN